MWWCSFKYSQICDSFYSESGDDGDDDGIFPISDLIVELSGATKIGSKIKSKELRDVYHDFCRIFSFHTLTSLIQHQQQRYNILLLVCMWDRFELHVVHEHIYISKV